MRQAIESQPPQASFGCETGPKTLTSYSVSNVIVANEETSRLRDEANIKDFETDSYG
jgi:hypothetical protein